MLLLFTPDDQLVHCDTLGRELRGRAPNILSRRVHGPYLGYLQAQKPRLTGERGQKRIHRPELDEMYGFDTKCAMHILRPGFQGVELLTTGRLSGELERQRADLEMTSALPEAPEDARLEEGVRDADRRSWRE